MIDGVAPEFEDIASGEYPVSRPLYFYVKKAHMGQIPGSRDTLPSSRATGRGAMTATSPTRGSIPMPEEARMQFAANVKNLTPLQLAME